MMSYDMIQGLFHSFSDEMTYDMYDSVNRCAALKRNEFPKHMRYPRP